MKNRNVGFLIIGISIVMAILVYIFNKGLKDIVGATCSHGPSCSMYTSISIQTWISLSITALVLLIGLFIVFSKEQEKIVFKKVQMPSKEAKKKPINYNSLDKEEKTIVKALEAAQGTMFQSDIVEKVGFDKVKVTRVLDRLEGKQLIERKRRGMTNIVILK
jgi:uncharacterized membrane protein